MKAQKTVLHTLAVLGLAAAGSLAAIAADTPTQKAPMHDHGGPMRGGPMMGGPGPAMMGMGMMGSPFMHAVHQLNLSPEQQQSIHSLMDSEHQKGKVMMQSAHANVDALANPGDPNYAAAVAAAKATAGNEIQHRSDIEVQIFSMLTADQKAQLPKIVADMKAKHEQHRGEMQKAHEHKGAN